MERIVYRITLDSHKTGIQRTLQGFETADNMARTIAVNITASGDTYEIPLDNVVAMMYVTTPNASEPSINECRIEDNTIYYDVLPIVEEGITEMKIKLIETSVDGAKRVLLAPKFVVEVTESGTEDDSAEQTTTFTALENAIAKAHGVYDQRLLNIEIGPDCVFRAIYADGTVYENHYLHEALYNGNALLSESWAKGGTGIREGEETNNSKYFSDVSRSSSIEASASADEVRKLVDFAKLYSTYTSFDTNFETGELEYISASHTFDIDETTGELSVEGDLFDPSEVLESVADDYMDEKTQEIAQLKSDFDNHTHTAEDVGAHPNTWMPTASDVGAIPIGLKGQAIYCDNLFATFEITTLVQWGVNTKNTPHKAGLTQGAEGFAIVVGDLSGWHSVLAWQKGGDRAYMWMHTVDGGIDHGWHDMTAYLSVNITPNNGYNSLNETGYYELQGNCPNNPYGSGNTNTHFYVEHFHHAYAGYNKQIAYCVSNEDVFQRTQNNGTWSAWRPFYTGHNVTCRTEPITAGTWLATDHIYQQIE